MAEIKLAYVEFTKEDKEKYRQKTINNMQNNIKKNTSKIWLPEINLKMKNVKTNSWFDIKKSYCNDNNNIEINFKTEKPKTAITKCKKIILKLTSPQKKL